MNVVALNRRSQARNPIFRGGFTLVELLAATILAAMLMAGVLGVLKAVTRSEKAVLREAPAPAWESRLVAQLQWDLVNSRTFAMIPGGFELQGYAGRDFRSGGVLHNPTSIQYAVKTVGGEPYLVRVESHLDSQSLENRSINLVCNRIERVALGSPDGTPSQATSNDVASPKTAEESPIPDRLLVCLYGPGQETPVFQHAFELR